MEDDVLSDYGFCYSACLTRVPPSVKTIYPSHGRDISAALTAFGKDGQDLNLSSASDL